MILKSIRLHPFAGIRDKKFEFVKQLNVVLGPNEAGKSTLFHAIWNGLLTTTSFTAQQLEKAMGRYFPSSGGDVIRVSLELADEKGETVHIHKTWKKGTRNGTATLQFSDGMEITREEEVQRKLTKLLPVSPATMKTILLAHQSGLHHTIRQMERENNVRKELGDLLRQSLMETAGVSVDRFRELLDSRYEEYFMRWNRSQDYPENNRGINNPYKINVGKVLQAFYKKERLQGELVKAQEFEERMDRINEKLSELMEVRNKKREQFLVMEPLKRGISQRKEHEQKLEVFALKEEQLQKINNLWPTLEERIRNLESQKKSSEEKIAKLHEELDAARQKQKADQLEERIGKLQTLYERMTGAEKELHEARKIEREVLHGLRTIQRETGNLKSRIEGARLTLRIVSDRNQNIRFNEAGKEVEEISTNQGVVVEKMASGGFRLEMEGVQIQVFSGDGDLESAVSEVAENEAQMKRHFEDLQIDTLQDAESLAEIYRQKYQQFESAKQLYTLEAGGKGLDNLRAELQELGIPEHVRAIDDIQNDLVDIQSAQKSCERDIRDAAEQIKSWRKEYESVKKIAREIGKVVYQAGIVEEELSLLPELPEGYASADDFIQETEVLDGEVRRLDERIHQGRLTKTEAERDAPELSSEELEKMAEEAAFDFQRIRNEGETLARVRARALELLERMDAGTYSGLEESFLNWLHQMSGNRFEKVEMDGDLPSLFKTDDGRPLTYDLLSHGTKDTVALAWRFALTEHFLKKERGMIILDDPMVDMDPVRRKQASNAIEQFVGSHQVILLTCHPEHQQGFENGAVIEM